MKKQFIIWKEQSGIPMSARPGKQTASKSHRCQKNFQKKQMTIRNLDNPFKKWKAPFSKRQTIQKTIIASELEKVGTVMQCN